MRANDRRADRVDAALPRHDPKRERAVTTVARIFGLSPAEVAELRETSADVFDGLTAKLEGREPANPHCSEWRRCCCARCQDTRRGYYGDEQAREAAQEV